MASSVSEQVDGSLATALGWSSAVTQLQTLVAKLPSVNLAVHDMRLDLVEDEEDDALAACQCANLSHLQ